MMRRTQCDQEKGSHLFGVYRYVSAEGNGSCKGRSTISSFAPSAVSLWMQRSSGRIMYPAAASFFCKLTDQTAQAFASPAITRIVIIRMTLSCWFDFLTFILYTVYTPDGMVDTPMKQFMDADNLDRRLKKYRTGTGYWPYGGWRCTLRRYSTENHDHRKFTSCSHFESEQIKGVFFETYHFITGACGLTGWSGTRLQ